MYENVQYRDINAVQGKLSLKQESAYISSEL